MKNNDLNVFTYGYIYKKRFIWKNLKQFFRNIKYAWQRATRGYCDQDAWNLYYFYTVLMRDSIRHLAEYHYGFPGDDEFDEPEKWSNYLYNISNLLDKSLERTFDDFQYYKNPYEEEFEKYLDRSRPADPDFHYIDTEEDEELFKHYKDEETHIYNLRKADREKAFKMILRRFDNLWD